MMASLDVFGVDVSAEACRTNVVVSGCAFGWHGSDVFLSDNLVLGLYVTGIAVSESTSASFSYARYPKILTADQSYSSSGLGHSGTVASSSVPSFRSYFWGRVLALSLSRPG